MNRKTDWNPNPFTRLSALEPAGMKINGGDTCREALLVWMEATTPGSVLRPDASG
jgi:hypothetical protein